MDEISRNNSQVHDDSCRFGNWGVGNVVPLRSKSEVRLRSAILSKLILLLLALTLQREKFDGVNAEDWPYTTETPENNWF